MLSFFDLIENEILRRSPLCPSLLDGNLWAAPQDDMQGVILLELVGSDGTAATGPYRVNPAAFLHPSSFRLHPCFRV
jgi:hypothetical protein